MLLSSIVFVPVIGAIIIALLPRDNPATVRLFAALATGLTFILSLLAWGSFNTGQSGFQLVEKTLWVPSIGVSYFLGVDGLNLPLIVLTTLLTFLSVLASWKVTLRPKEYFALLLVLETGVLGVFTALDLALFFLFWEVELIPMYLLIGIWGGSKREYAAIKFVIYTLLGSGMMLVGFLALYFRSGTDVASRTFDMTVLSTLSFDPTFAGVAFLFIFFGFAVKLPVFPFHTWLPDAHVEAPTAVSVLLAGVLLKMGGYGMLRINLGILPDAAHQFSLLIGILAVINILYGAAVSLVQRDLKSLVAYSSISHMGYVLLGFSALSAASLGGSAIQLFTHGVITGLLFLLVGAVYDRAHTRQISELRGLAPRMPLIATIFVLAGLASLGLPGLAGFIGEFAVFVGAYPIVPVFTVLAAFGIVITAGYILWTLQRVFFGPPDERWAHLGDARGIEMAPLLTLAAVVVLVGLFPSPLTDIINQGISSLSGRLGG